MAKRVLITGVTGFVGMHLGAALAGDGVEVVGLVRDAARAKRRAPFLHEAFEWRALEGPERARVLDVSAVVHLAGEPVAGIWTASKRASIEASRVTTTRALVDAMEAVDARPAVFVCASAVGYYGDPPDREIVETDRAGEGFLAQVCVRWEREAERAEPLGVRVLRMRFGLVLGREGGSLAAMLPAYKAGLGGTLGSGRQVWPWIHIADVVRLIRHGIDDVSWSGAYNATAPAPVTQKEFARTLARVLRRPAFLPTPAFVLKAVLGGFSSELLVSRRVVPRRALEAGFVFRFPELEPALRDLVAAPHA